MIQRENEKKKNCSKLHFIEPNLNVNNHWMVPYKIVIFSCGLEIQDGHQNRTKFYQTLLGNFFFS